ncbi:MAG: hypothetical protein AB7S26_06425 [Sandaracinaceae bacterium]
MVMDTRAAAGRNDPEFETKILPRILTLLARFEEIGILVKTQAGKMQAQRVSRERGLGHQVFADPDEADRFLTRR